MSFLLVDVQMNSNKAPLSVQLKYFLNVIPKISDDVRMRVDFAFLFGDAGRSFIPYGMQRYNLSAPVFPPIDMVKRPKLKLL